jgi:EpsI family protein
MTPGRRDVLLGGAAAAAAATAFLGMPDKPMKLIPDDTLERIIPQQVGDYVYETTSGLILPPPDQLARLLYSQQVTRIYTAPDQPTIMLLMAYGSSQGGMLQIHRPEVCYPASGFRLSETERLAIPLGGARQIPARYFIASSDARTEHVLYWTRIGDRLPSSWTGQRMAVVKANLAGFVPDGLLARVSVMAQEGIEPHALLEGFARAMLNQMPVAERRMLVGTAGG